MTDKTHRERQARFRENQRMLGLARVEEWIPEECVDVLKAIAAEMRARGRMRYRISATPQKHQQ